jgi:hypothetical protein
LTDKQAERYCWDLHLHNFCLEEGMNWWSLGRERKDWKALTYAFTEFSRPFDGKEVNDPVDAQFSAADIIDVYYVQPWCDNEFLKAVG